MMLTGMIDVDMMQPTKLITCKCGVEFEDDGVFVI